MKKNIETLRTNKVRKAQLNLSKHKSMGTQSNFSIHEVASLMDVVNNRSQIKNESMLFSIHMN